MKSMKKIATVLASLCLAFVMVVTLTACGGGKEFDSIQEYIDAQKEQIDEAIKANEGSGMTMEVKADGDTLMPVGEETTSYFDNNIDNFKAQFEAVINEMKELIDVKDPKVKLVYENPDGTVIYEHTIE